MKTAIVYFSLEGNTKFVAEKIAAELKADLIRLVPVNEYPTGNVSKYFWGGKSSAFKESPRLEPYAFEASKYDLVLLGTPIWAGTYTPPLRTFLRANKLTGKNVALFACCSGGSAEKCFEDFEKELTNCKVISTLRVVDPIKNDNPSQDESIVGFCKILTKR